MVVQEEQQQFILVRAKKALRPAGEEGESLYYIALNRLYRGEYK